MSKQIVKSTTRVTLQQEIANFLTRLPSKELVTFKWQEGKESFGIYREFSFILIHDSSYINI